MIITTRHKTSGGILLGYTVLSDGKQIYVDKDEAIALSKFITNATLTQNNEYRVLKGSHIETVIRYNELTVNKTTKPAIKTDVRFTCKYYGEGHINECKKIRRYALEGNIQIDTSAHKSNRGANIHLFKLIEACGISLRTFILSYLSVLQPYSLEDFQENNVDNHIWLVDVGYKIQLVIKVNEQNKRAPVVVSFHESNMKGKYVPDRKDFSDKLCAVIVDDVKQLPNGYAVDYTIQRGFIRLQVDSTTTYYNNGIALVEYKDIKHIYDSSIRLAVQQMQNIYYDGNKVNSPVFVRSIDTNRISFMSNGFASVNNIFMLIDLYNQYTDINSRKVILEITSNILDEIPQIRKDEFKIALQSNFNRDDENKLLIAVKSMLT